MTTHTRHALDTPWRRLLAGVLVVCVTLAAVPALAHCCADRCHDAEPVATQAGDCDCSLRGVEPPVDALPCAPDPVAALVVHGDGPAIADITPPERPETTPDPANTRGAPDRTVVLLI